MLLQALFSRFRHGSPTQSYPVETAPPAPPSFAGAPVIIADKCQLCSECVDACPTGALAIEVDTTQHGRSAGREVVAWTLQYDKCILCGICVSTCQHRAIAPSGRYDLAVLERADLSLHHVKSANTVEPANVVEPSNMAETNEVQPVVV